MDELLTTFFQAEIPESRLAGLPPGLRASAARPDMSAQVPGRSQPGERWTTLALAGCAAALIAAAVLAVRFGGSESDEARRVGAAAGESAADRAINVSHDEADDLTAPEQDIEILETLEADK